MHALNHIFYLFFIFLLTIDFNYTISHLKSYPNKNSLFNRSLPLLDMVILSSYILNQSFFGASLFSLSLAHAFEIQPSLFVKVLMFYCLRIHSVYRLSCYTSLHLLMSSKDLKNPPDFSEGF